MTYRQGTVEDWPKIAEFVGNTDYFEPINPVTLGGRWVVAEHEGKLHAVSFDRHASTATPWL